MQLQLTFKHPFLKPKKAAVFGSLFRKRKKDEFVFYLNYRIDTAIVVPLPIDIFKKNITICFYVIILVKIFLNPYLHTKRSRF